jgi:hypothetical protein
MITTKIRKFYESLVALFRKLSSVDIKHFHRGFNMYPSYALF